MRWVFLLSVVVLGVSSVPLPAINKIQQSEDQGLLIAVVTAPSHVTARQSIRDTWAAKAAEMGATVKFFIGELPPGASITDEAINSEGGIIRLQGFSESYHNLTAKAIAIFDYAYQNGFKGVFKVDDDTYVRVPKLVNFLSSQGNWDNLYAGVFIRGNHVSSNPKSKWYAADQYSESIYPPYCDGPGVFLGRSGTQYIAEHKDSLNRIRVDDAALGVWMHEKGGMSLVDMPAASWLFNVDQEHVYSNPINAVEMIKCFNNEHVTPEICMGGNYECLCRGNPQYSESEVNACWNRFSNDPYSDYVPRKTTL